MGFGYIITHIKRNNMKQTRKGCGCKGNGKPKPTPPPIKTR